MSEQSQTIRIAKAIREEIVRQYRDDDRGKCPAGVPFWEEEVQPILLAETALRALKD
jgi:N-acetylmuramoyl-L-alanine amidase